MANTHMGEKVRIILIPHLIFAFTFPAVYMGFTWFRHSVLGFEEENVWLYFWLPLCCIIGLLILFFWRRYRILVLTNGRAGVLFIATSCILAPTMVGQHYITKAIYPLVPIERISAIKEDYQRYFAVRNFYVDTSSGYTLMKRKVVRKGRDVRLDFYLVAPMYDGSSKWPSPARAWYVEQFTKKVSNRIDPGIREAQIAAHQKATDSRWQQLKLSRVRYFENCIDLADKPLFLEAVRTRVPSAAENIPVLMPVYTPFEERVNLTRKWLLLSSLIGAAIFSLVIIFTDVDYVELSDYHRGL